MSGKLHIDLETFSEADLKAEGLYRYAEHESTDIVVASYALNDGPVHVWLPWTDVPPDVVLKLRAAAPLQFGPELPADLRAMLEDPTVRIAAHHAAFERKQFDGTIGKRYNIPHIPIERWICTMAKAAVHGLPHALEGAAAALGTFPKRKVGVTEMRYLSKPRKDGTRPTAMEEPERLVETTLYNIDDVKAERDLDNNIPDLTPAEEQIYFLDQRINDRGVRVDIPSIHNILYLVEQHKIKLAAWCKATTGLSPSQTGKLAEYIREHGYPQLRDLQAATVRETLEDPGCPDDIKKLLRCYSIYAGKAVSKFDAMLRAVCKDGRLHGLFRYYGAGPGRWSSIIVQLQNLLRSLLKPDEVDQAIEACKSRDAGKLKALFPQLELMKILASCSRGMLIPDDDKDFIAYDFSQIESCIQAWLSDAEWKLKILREGKIKIYQASGSMMFGIPVEKVVDSGTDFIYTAAKVGELACGYQGWAAAIEKMARQMGAKLTLPAEEIADRWRKANQRQVATWKYLEDAAKAAVEHPGQAYAIPNKKISFKVVGRWLYLRLPGGRRIAYLDPQIHVAKKPPEHADTCSTWSGEVCDCAASKFEPGDDRLRDDAVTYTGVDTYTRRRMRVGAYGGKWMQNACEGIGRDLLVNGLQHMEAAGYTAAMTAHDEGTFEVDWDFGDMEEAKRLMTIPLPWAAGLPVRASGWRARRYRK